MDAINLTETLIGREVELLFSEILLSLMVFARIQSRASGMFAVSIRSHHRRRRRTVRFWPANGSPLPPRPTRRRFLSTSTTAKTGSERGGYWTTSSRYTLGRWMIGMT